MRNTNAEQRELILVSFNAEARQTTIGDSDLPHKPSWQRLDVRSQSKHGHYKEVRTTALRLSLIHI